MIESNGFQTRAAALLRATANDLKRDDEAAERDLGLAPGTFAEYTSGARPLTWELIGRAAQVWPVNERDLLPIQDDCPTGVRICEPAESVASSRTITRGSVPYYEYRDTAMSRVASYRPEWIRMLQAVSDNDPDNPAVQWNNGHLLYQFTYFVGPVNYYYEWEGRRHCVPMQTGDSVWGLPFVPHSFTARSADEAGYILALTYGGGLTGDVQRELAVQDDAAVEASAIDVIAARGAHSPVAALLRSHVDARLATVKQLSARTGIAPQRLRSLLSGSDPADWELAALAGAMRISVRELQPPQCHAIDGASIQRRASAAHWPCPQDDPAYQVTELAGDPLHPHTTAVELEVLRADRHEAAELRTYQHQYLYVLPPAGVDLHWEYGGGRRHTARLEPDASAYVLPQVPITLTRTRPAPTPVVLLLRIAEKVDSEIRFALGAMARDGIRRYLSEDRQWYFAKGGSRAVTRPESSLY